jgi:hypothetical protein
MNDVKTTINGVNVMVTNSNCYILDGKISFKCIDFINKLVNEIPIAKQLSARNMLKLYNETWLDESIGILNDDKFIARLKVSEITILDEPGAAILYFSDGNIFGGHFIEIVYDEGIMKNCGLIG